MKKIMSLMLITILLMSAAIPSYAAGFTPPGLAKKGGLPPGIAKKFKDLDGFEWAQEAIERLAEKGILSGVGEEKFAPSSNVTKIEALAMIIRGLDWDDEADLSLELIQKGKIKDKVKDQLQDWTKGYIEVAIQRGLISEADVTKQSFTTPATRQEVAMYIIRAMGLEAKAKKYTKDDLSFDDKNAVKSDAAGYVYLIAQEGIMKGYPDGTFRPNQPVKRAEMASLVATLNDKIDDDDDEDVERVSGKLIWFNAEKIYIEKSGKVESYALDDDVKVYIDGKQKTLDDLRLDKTITLKVEEKLVKEIRWNTEVVVIEDSFKGSITDIDRTDKEVVVKNDSKEKLFKVENNTVIKIDGRTKNFSDLSIGMKVELKIIDGKVDSISAQTNTETFKGTIKQIYASTEKLKIQVGSQERIIQVDDETDIELNGNNVAFKHLAVGMKVEVAIENGEVLQVYAKSVEEEFSGVIAGINSTRKELKLKVGSTERTIQLDSGTDIEVDGKDAGFDKLVLNMKVEVRIENGKVVELSAKSVTNEYTGTLIEKVVGTQNKLTIKVGSQYKTYVVAKDAEILDDDGDEIDFSELKVGSEIEIQVENNIIVEIEVED
ncbi:hypothetical protein HNQ80_002870 [Anaerosolibacter carboniphilus]|uniref:SLH domain-containing protein n=1 Tax=Anaerosolibacter carboniphilus TaxID=1417629 RepID=A0A841KT44_9FIRM|nr:S-layer homology domain-containing protein [Anaerosolibacter carboniphilus]MBB6216766.1 hypothetical protein [Anaerosolibacter carboniphilus]